MKESAIVAALSLFLLRPNRWGCFRPFRPFEEGLHAVRIAYRPYGVAGMEALRCRRIHDGSFRPFDAQYQRRGVFAHLRIAEREPVEGRIRRQRVGDDSQRGRPGFPAALPAFGALLFQDAAEIPELFIGAHDRQFVIREELRTAARKLQQPVAATDGNDGNAVTASEIDVVERPAGNGRFGRNRELGHVQISEGQLFLTERLSAQLFRIVALEILAEPFGHLGRAFVQPFGEGDAGEEIQEAATAFSTLGLKLREAIPFELPQNAGKRAIVVCEKIKKTPSAYPRGRGKERSRPL